MLSDRMVAFVDRMSTGASVSCELMAAETPMNPTSSCPAWRACSVRPSPSNTMMSVLSPYLSRMAAICASLAANWLVSVTLRPITRSVFSGAGSSGIAIDASCAAADNGASAPSAMLVLAANASSRLLRSIDIASSNSR